MVSAKLIAGIIKFRRKDLKDLCYLGYFIYNRSLNLKFDLLIHFVIKIKAKVSRILRLRIKQKVSFTDVVYILFVQTLKIIVFDL